MEFYGPGYEKEYDYKRLKTQHDRIKALMIDGKWRSLSEINALTGHPEASISAMLRKFRDVKHGGHTVLRRRRGNPKHGLHEYRLILRKEI